MSAERAIPPVIVTASPLARLQRARNWAISFTGGCAIRAYPRLHSWHRSAVPAARIRDRRTKSEALDGPLQSSSCDSVAAGFAHSSDGVNRRSSRQNGGMRCHILFREDLRPKP